MLYLIILGVAFAAAVSGQKCEHSSCNIGLIKYYQELNCRPVLESGACCPKRFDCTAATSGRALNKCHVKGRSYSIGSRLTKEQVGNKCVAECRCTGDGPVAHLNCANIECPEHLGVRPPAGCSYTYSHDKCCSSGTICTTTPFTCQHGGKSYRVGEKFYPDEEPCLMCICQEGYDDLYCENGLPVLKI